MIPDRTGKLQLANDLCLLIGAVSGYLSTS